MSNIGYQAFGDINQLTWGNGLILNRRYDQSTQLISQTISNNIQRLSYKYDGISNIISITDHNNSQQSQQYRYDAVDRLEQQVTEQQKIDYSYDAVGNRLSATQTQITEASDAEPDTQTDTYQYASDSNQLISINDVEQIFSPSGRGIVRDLSEANLLTDEQKTLLNFSYDAQDRIQVVSKNSVQQASYTYNNNGQRSVKHSSNGDITHYHYNLQGQIIGESQYNSTGTLQHNISYIWLNNKPVAQINTSNVPSSLNQSDISYIHFDHLNTPRLATNSAKTIIWSWHSEAFGSTLANADPDNNSIETHINLRFPGQYYDDETGLHYNYYRYYDSVTGRYVTSDPIGLEGGVNTFAYVGGNPVGWVDPEGNVGLLGGAIGAAIGAGAGALSAHLNGTDILVGAGIGATTGFVTGFTAGVGGSLSVFAGTGALTGAASSAASEYANNECSSSQSIGKAALLGGAIGLLTGSLGHTAAAANALAHVRNGSAKRISLFKGDLAGGIVGTGAGIALDQALQ